VQEEASHSSATESLLGRLPSPNRADHHHYPPDPATDLEAAGEKELLEAPARGRSHGPAHVAVQVPTRDQVVHAKQHPRRRPRHLVAVGVGLVSLLTLAWTVTWVLSLGTRFGGQDPKLQVILMISDGMGACSPLPGLELVSPPRSRSAPTHLGPASETMARSYVQYLYSTNSSVSGTSRPLLNETAFADLTSGFEGRADGAGRLPLDDILVGTSRVRLALPA